MSKHRFYEGIIKRSLAEAYQRMEYFLSKVPDECDIEEDTDVTDAIKNILAIEEEWIIDPAIRRQLSLLDLSDELDPDDPLL